MRRIALCLYGLCLVAPMIGCNSEEPAAPVTPPADGAAAPADDAAAPVEDAQ